MHLSRWQFWIVCALTLGCSVGNGAGNAIGNVTAPTCELVDAPMNLEFEFFAAQELEPSGLEIRMQEGADEPQLSNGIVIFIADSAMESARLGESIELSTAVDAPVRMTYYLHAECGQIELNRLIDSPQPVHYVAESGTIRFNSIYSPEVSNSLETSAVFENVHFVDPGDADQRFADIDGSFRVIFNRGRPAQRFP